MELPLVYPTKNLSSVKVGGLSTKLIKLLSNQDLVTTGEILYEVLSSVCPGTQPVQFKDVSLVDANRIVLTAWKNTHRSDKYVAKVKCPENCGRTNLVVHDINVDYVKPDVYDKNIPFETMDTSTLEEKTVEITLRPIPLKLYESIIQGAVSDDVTDMTEMLVWCRIKSVDGNEDFDKDNMSMALYGQLTDLVDADTAATLGMFEKAVTCEKCGHEYTNSVFWLDAGFMQGK